MEYCVLERKNVIRAAEEDMQIPACYQMLGVCFLKNNIKVQRRFLTAQLSGMQRCPEYM